ncbi:MAG TPA: STAS domain-containing protein [Methanospirillum sp.]|uniref:STAS domain-containing protein n=1 Tax=Methanospirillum sp. TaxID=45200 RepID=UPI002C1F02C7|nr:STAS domain-containing protein [Methanospirillum sp.]HWQ62817.1 STAS domain-containing protein [Methanospirillum sp.]
MTDNDRLKGDTVSYLIRDEMGDCMPIDIWYDGNVWVFRPFGKIDTGHSVDLDTALTEGIEQGMRFIVIDMTDSPYIASSGLRAMLKAAKAVKPDNGSISVCGLNDVVHEVLQVSGLLRIFPVYPTAKEAVSAMQNIEK